MSAENEKNVWGLELVGKIFVIVPPTCQKTYRIKNVDFTEKLENTHVQVPVFLGKGSYGVVFAVCDNSNECNYAMKIQIIVFEDQVINFKKELDYSTLFGKEKISPRLYDGWICKGYLSRNNEPVDIGIIVYEKWGGELLNDDVLSKKMLAKWKRMIELMHKKGYIHADLFPKNILVKRNKKGDVVDMVFTDFGLSNTIENFKANTMNIFSLCMTINRWDYIELPGIRRVLYNMTNTNNMKDACDKLTQNPELIDWVVYNYYVKRPKISPVPHILRNRITGKQWLGDYLDLSYQNIGLEGVKALAKWKGRTLILGGNRIGPEGAKALAEWKGRILHLSDNDIGDPGAKALAKWKGTNLDLSSNHIGSLGVKALAKWEGRILHLSDNDIGDEDAKVLAKWKGTNLDLSENDIGDPGAAHLSKWGGTHLDLWRNKIGDEGVKALAKWGGHTLNLEPT